MQLFCEPSVGKEDSEEMDLLKEEETELRALLDKLRGLQESHGVYSLAVKAMLAERLQTHRPDSMLSDPACASLGVGESVPKALLCRLKMQSFRQWRKKNCGIGDSDPLKALQRKLRADIANAAGKRIIEPAGNRPSLLPVESFHRKVMVSQNAWLSFKLPILS